MSSDFFPAPIPEPVQRTVHGLAERMKFFVAQSEEGGSWIELQTWLLSMQPSFDLLTEIGLDGIPRTARMTISSERQDEIASTFVVPDSLEGT